MVWIFSQMSACRKLAILAALFATLLMLLSCVNGSSGEQSATPLTDDLDRDSLRTAVQYSIAYLQKIPPEQIVGEQPRVFTAGEILDSLQEFDRLLDDWSCRPCFAREIERRFELVPSSMDSATTEVLFTGYYQPVIDGSLVRTEKFRYPVYGRPADLIIAEQVLLKPQLSVEKIVGRAEGVVEMDHQRPLRRVGRGERLGRPPRGWRRRRPAEKDRRRVGGRLGASDVGQLTVRRSARKARTRDGILAACRFRSSNAALAAAPPRRGPWSR